MKAILIDPFAQTVTEADYGGDYTQIYTLIKADTFDIVGLSDSESMFVDDNGLLGDPAEQRLFDWLGYHQPIAGRALILGTNEDGESVATALTVDEVARHVTWRPHLEFSHITTATGDLPDGGGFAIRQKAHFKPRGDE